MITRLNKGSKAENHKDEIKLITPPCNNNNGGIIDVDELPSRWKGTPVPNSGYVEKVYFNTNLSNEEVNSLLWELARILNNDLYDVTYDNTGWSNIYFEMTSSECIICDLTTNPIYENGWRNFNNPNILNTYVVPEYDGFPVGTHNHLVSSLVSITPFEEVPIDTNSIYRLPDGTLWMYKDGSWVGLTVGEPETEELTVTPSGTVQEFTPSEDTYFNKVTVEAIQSDYIGPDVPTVEETTIVPSTTDQTIDGGKYLSGQVTVKGDANLVAENIKEGVTLYKGTNGEIVGTCTSGSDAWLELTQTRINTTKSCQMLCTKYAGNNIDFISALDTSNVTDMSYMFQDCTNITTIPLLDTSNVTNMYYMFSNCQNLTSIPQLDTSNVTVMSYMFSTCRKLTTSPLLDTSKVTNFTKMFSYCTQLTTVLELDVSGASSPTSMSDMFNNCTRLKTILMTGMRASFNISVSTQFEREDLVTILNNLATVTTATTLTMGSTNLAKLTDADKAIATAKGWTLA